MSIKKSRVLLVPALLLSAAFALTSCGFSTGAEPSKSSEASESLGEPIVVGTRVVPETIDPAQASNANNDFYVAALYDHVVRYDSEGVVQPSIATEWEYSDDATELTLQIRDGVEFHSGNPLTAADVAYTLDRLKAVGSGSAGLIVDYDSSVVNSDTELVVKLAQPNLNFIGALSAVYVLDSELVKQNEGSDHAQQWLSSNDAGSGPYRLTAYNPNQQVDFEAVSDHWFEVGARPSKIATRIITEPSAIRDEMRSGGLDIGYGVPSTDIASFDGVDDFQVTTLPTTRVTLAVMNMDGEVTSDPRVREAIQLAYDVPGHVATALGGYGEAADSLVPAFMQCRVQQAPVKQDLDAARKLVDEAGATGKKISIAYQPVIPEHNTAGTLLQAALTDIGFEVEVRQVTFSQQLESIKSPDTTPDVAILWDIAPYPAIGPMLEHTWSTSMIGNANFARYSNPKVDDLLDAGLSATDPDAACASFEDAQDLILADRPAVIIGFPSLSIIHTAKVKDIPYSPIAPTFDIAQVSLAK